MKVAISSSGKNLDSQIDPRFGRCSYFILCDTNTMDFDVFDNESLNLSGSAGIQSGQFISSKGAEALITGNCGPNAVKVLNAAKITMYTGQSGTVRDAVERLLKNELHASSEANVPDHYGVMGREASSQEENSGPVHNQSVGFGMGGGRGMGMGSGRGGCMGGGKGMGRGMGRGGGAGMAGADEFRVPSRSSNSKEEELRLLKKQAEDLLKQAGDIQARINSLENN